MNENDFYVAIQGVLEQARSRGWDIDLIHELAYDAADEWLGEIETDEYDND